MNVGGELKIIKRFVVQCVVQYVSFALGGNVASPQAFRLHYSTTNGAVHLYIISSHRSMYGVKHPSGKKYW